MKNKNYHLNKFPQRCFVKIKKGGENSLHEVDNTTRNFNATANYNAVVWTALQCSVIPYRNNCLFLVSKVCGPSGWGHKGHCSALLCGATLHCTAVHTLAVQCIRVLCSVVHNVFTLFVYRGILMRQPLLPPPL